MPRAALRCLRDLGLLLGDTLVQREPDDSSVGFGSAGERPSKNAGQSDTDRAGRRRRTRSRRAGGTLSTLAPSDTLTLLLRQSGVGIRSARDVSYRPEGTVRKRPDECSLLDLPANPANALVCNVPRRVLAMAPCLFGATSLTAHLNATGSLSGPSDGYLEEGIRDGQSSGLLETGSRVPRTSRPGNCTLDSGTAGFRCLTRAPYKTANCGSRCGTAAAPLAFCHLPGKGTLRGPTNSQMCLAAVDCPFSTIYGCAQSIQIRCQSVSGNLPEANYVLEPEPSRQRAP